MNPLIQTIHLNDQKPIHYIAALIALLELQIIHLGESNIDHQGVWLDGSTSLRSHMHLRGSPEKVF